jgi:pimeloyl-ACP methyl ester carboxylesterase
VFVHGAFHQSWVWDAALELLKDSDLKGQTVDLPSVAAGTQTRRCMHDDATVIGEVLSEIRGPVIVVAHSYGGIPVSQVAHQSSNVHHIVYVAAFVLDVGESVLGLAGGQIPPWWIVDDGIVTVGDPGVDLYHDVEPEVARWARTRLLPSTFAIFGESLTEAAWRCTPSTYLICQHDQALPVSLQETMAKRTGRIERLASSHSPMLSLPGELVDIVHGVAARL